MQKSGVQDGPAKTLVTPSPKGPGLRGARSGLVYDFLRLARVRQPRWLILENVPGLLSADGGQALESVVDALEESGYMGGWTTCNALDFGLPQDRERVIIVASHGNDLAYHVLAHGGQLRRDSAARGQQRADSAAEDAGSTGEHDPVVVQRRGGFGYTKGSRVCPTIRAQTGKHQGGHSDRPILCGQTLDVDRMREVARLPRRLDSRRGRLIGNAVPVPLAHWFAQTIMAVEHGTATTATP